MTVISTQGVFRRPCAMTNELRLKNEEFFSNMGKVLSRLAKALDLRYLTRHCGSMGKGERK
jgi:hypothetical protein